MEKQSFIDAHVAAAFIAGKTGVTLEGIRNSTVLKIDKETTEDQIAAVREQAAALGFSVEEK